MITPTKVKGIIDLTKFMSHKLQNLLMVTRSIKIKGMTKIANACNGGINKLIKGIARIGKPSPKPAFPIP